MTSHLRLRYNSFLYFEGHILQQPSLRYQIAQMLLFGFEGTQIEDHNPIVKSISEEGIGGVILFDYDYQTKQFGKNIQNASKCNKMHHVAYAPRHECTKMKRTMRMHHNAS